MQFSFTQFDCNFLCFFKPTESICCHNGNNNIQDRYFANQIKLKVRKNIPFLGSYGPQKFLKPSFISSCVFQFKYTFSNVEALELHTIYQKVYINHGVYHGYHIPKNEVWMDKIKLIKNCIQIWKSRVRY